MTTLFDDSNYGMYENQGGILQNPGQDAPGIALSDPAQSMLPQSANTANTQDLRRNAIAQMGTGQKILSAIGEFGAGVQGHPSPLNAQIRQQREDSLMKVQEFKAHSDALEDGVKMAQRMTGDARKNFITEYAKQLEAVRPGLGKTYESLSGTPDMGTVLAKYSDKSPTLKRAVELDPSGGAALKLISSPDAMKTINAEIDSNVMPTLSQKGQTFLMGWQQLVPKEMADKINQDGRVSASELLKANDWIRANKPDLAKTLAFSDEDLQIIGRNEDAFYGSLGMLTPKDDREIARKKAEDKGKRELTEIGVGKDPKGNDLFQKAYIEGGNVVGKVGEPYLKKDGVTVTVGQPIQGLDAKGNLGYYQPSKQGGPAVQIPNIVPPKAGNEPLSKEAIDNIAIQSMYDKNVFGRLDPDSRRQVENRVPELMKEYGITSQDVVAGRAGYKADAASLAALTKQYDAVSSFQNTAIRNGDQLMALADKIDKTGVPVIEKWIRQGRSALGDADVAKFDAQLQIYRTETAKILTNPNLSGQLTDAARHEVEGFLKGGSSADQIRGVVNLLKSDFGNRITTIKEQMDAAHQRISSQVETKALPNTSLSTPPDSNPGTGKSMGDTLPSGAKILQKGEKYGPRDAQARGGEVQSVEDGKTYVFPDRQSFENWQRVKNGKPTKP